MREFAQLYEQLDASNGVNDKIEAMVGFFRRAADADIAWTVFLLTGRRLHRVVTAAELRRACLAAANIDEWLFNECHGMVGDTAETAAMLLPDHGASDDRPLHAWIEEQLLPLRMETSHARQQHLLAAWRELNQTERFLWNKLITGGFRVGVASRLVARALAKAFGVPADVIQHRLMGEWSPSADRVRQWRDTTTTDTDAARPYPFCLAHPLLEPPETLGPVGQWLAEWKLDGIRAQILRRQGRTWIWSRGEEPIEASFPELLADADALPDGTVLDGEIVVWRDDGVGAFADLQHRLQRKQVGKKLLAATPVRFIAFDLLEAGGNDLRAMTLTTRRQQLAAVIANARARWLDPDACRFALAETLPADDWGQLAELRQQSRRRGVEGLMLKRVESPYTVGRQTGVWWKWKIEPLHIDAVLVSAELGHGRRAGLFTDYTFALWREGVLLPFAKAYSGLNDAEIRQVDRFIREHVVGRHGPVRQVKPELVFELAFENIQLSKRHKAGVAVRFPRIARWRLDKRPQDADSLDQLLALAQGATS